MKKLLLLLFCISFTLHGQTERAWLPTDKTPVHSKNVQRLSFPDEFRLVGSNLTIIRQALANAPQRFTSQAGVIISIPNADGGMERYEVFEASNFEPGLQSQFPEIRSYSGKGIDDPMATLRMSIDPKGIQGMIFRT